MKSRFPNNKFIIGTAQIHSNYGILHNKINSINESNKILFFAKKKKYQMIDAASI